MQIYIVESITEADYGCEETGRKQPMALLKLIDDASETEEKYVEVSEELLAKQKITEGKKVSFTYDSTVIIFSYLRGGLIAPRFFSHRLMCPITSCYNFLFY